ncbi:peptide ABC transporter substrate-binding protein [Rosistilla oblonga]|uniref:Oligopeptide-binding protein OppA n=1 Tax=Rosistilla oblonga TaxID=2527990 RepID=A0A518IYP8_9BACT|nr:peptide ABC transporter substrate-binding protein [Rosistilla oblonga]QDV58216.1 Oligopeptide-binding protein OppA precursor [Rosistilla oblonga]
MPPEIRRAFPWFLVGVCGCAVIWALSFTTLPPADFAFQNGDDVKTLDPARATGEPEHKILQALFEGLLRSVPDGPVDENGLQDVTLVPGMADLPEISEDGRTYTFRMRDGMKWSDGTPVTSRDFAWSWQRVLHPETASEYSSQLYYVVGGKEYNTAEVAVGDRVEAELRERPASPDPLQPFPRGTVVHGILESIEKPERPEIEDETSDEGKKLLADWQNDWVYAIDVKPQTDAGIDWDAAGQLRYFTKQTDGGEFDGKKLESVHQVLIDFAHFGGVETPDDQTLIVKLNEPTPFFSYLTGFYTLFAVNRECVEKYGAPAWTKSENMVCNGPYELEFRRIRDRIRLRKNPYYWNTDAVDLDRIDAYSVKSQTTALNMYLKDQLHWASDVPLSVIEEIQERDDAKVGVSLAVYFYRLNTTRKPLDDVRVRRALNLAIDKQQIVNEVTRAGQIPAESIVPPYLSEYQSPSGEGYDPELARQLLADAGFPGGRGMPTLSILYNTSESHRAIAEVIQQQWQNNLNVKASLENMEWGTYLDKVFTMDFTIARGGWNGDYPDPNTFLEMWTTGNSHNSTGWSSPEYDKLIAQSQAASGQERMDLLRQAESIFLKDLPVIPLYFYTRTNLFSPDYAGFEPNVMDQHPLHLIRRRDSNDE